MTLRLSAVEIPCGSTFALDSLKVSMRSGPKDAVLVRLYSQRPWRNKMPTSIDNQVPDALASSHTRCRLERVTRISIAIE